MSVENPNQGCASSGANRRDRAFHYVSRGGLCSDDRRWIQRHGDGQNDSSGVFHHRLWNRARSGWALCELQSLAPRVCHHHDGRAFLHTYVDERDHQQIWRNPSQRAGGKIHFFVLFFLGGLATTAKSEAVLPAYLVGLVVAGVFLRDKTLVYCTRSIAFAMFTPFYFIKAGLYVSLPALWPALAVIVGLLFLKMLTKTVGVWPLARTHLMNRREASYTTLLMATGLTFGTISALFGFQNHIIDQRQYTILVTVVILSAFVPTLVAQKFFQPTKDAMRAWGRRYSYGLGVLSVEDAETETNNGID